MASTLAAIFRIKLFHFRCPVGRHSALGLIGDCILIKKDPNLRSVLLQSVLKWLTVRLHLSYGP